MRDERTIKLLGNLMILRDVQLVNGGKSSKEKLEQNKYLMNYWNLVEDIFCIYLPDKFDFAGLAKLNVYLGRYSGEDYIPPRSDGIAAYKRDDFIFDDFCELSDHSKCVKSLYYLTDSLKIIGNRLNVPFEILNTIDLIAEKVLGCDFQLERIHKKTSKWKKSRNIRATTTLTYKIGGIDINFALIDKSGSVLYSKQLFSNQFRDSTWFILFHGAWRDSIFTITNRVEKPIFSIDSSELPVT